MTIQVFEQELFELPLLRGYRITVRHQRRRAADIVRMRGGNARDIARGRRDQIDNQRMNDAPATARPLPVAPASASRSARRRRYRDCYTQSHPRNSRFAPPASAARRSRSARRYRTAAARSRVNNVSEYLRAFQSKD